MDELRHATKRATKAAFAARAQAQTPRAGLVIERAGTGGDLGAETIDVFVSANAKDAPFLGELAIFLAELPRELWTRVRVIDSRGRAALHTGGSK